MKVAEILRTKGNQVASVGIDARLRDAVNQLNNRNIGALLVHTAETALAGIISERDVVRHLARWQGPGDPLDVPVSSVMTSKVWTCTSSDDVGMLMESMTERRIRHVPVIDERRLNGLVSIGDIVKSRLGELEQDNRALDEYIHAR